MRSARRARLPGAVLGAAIAVSAASAGAAGLQPQDLHRLRSVIDARIAPDGRRVAYTVRDPSGPGAPAATTLVLDLATHRSITLGPGRAWGPRWSPDGRRLAYQAVAPEGVALMVVAADGSGARRVASLLGTNEALPSTGESVAWSPDGRRLAYVSAVAGAPASADPVVVDRYLYKPTASEGETRSSDGRRLHLFVVGVDPPSPPRALTSGVNHEHSIAWSPDGREIAYVSDTDGDERAFNYDLWALRVDATPAQPRRLTETPSAEYAPAWSPDGKRIAFLATKRPLTSSETTMEDDHVWMMDADGGNRREVGAGMDNRQGEPRWWPAGGLLATVQEGGDVALYRFPLAGAAERLVPAAGTAGVVVSWSVAGDGTMAYARSTADAPADLYVRSAGKTERLTSLNEELLSAAGRAAVEPLRFKSFDGMPIEAFVTLPLAGPPAAGAARSPLIVILHGGPHAQQGRAFNSRAQVYAARGWASLQVNYRGSTGYGQKLADAIFGDQDGGEAKDVLAAVDAALSTHPWLDPERLGIEGGSYGGQLVNYLVAWNSRFRAAVSSAGISNLVSFHYLSYYHDYLPVEFGAYPHEGELADRLWRRSALAHVSAARTPVLLLHGENDNDVPIAESEQFYVALQEVGVPTRLVRYPREGHGLRETGHQVDALQRSIEWYETWFGRERPQPRPVRMPEGSTPDLPAGPSLPARVTDALDRAFPGWSPNPASADVARLFAQRSPVQPHNWVTADLDGDGDVDFAVLLRRDAPQEQRLVVLSARSSDEDAAYEAVTVFRSPYPVPDYYLELHAKDSRGADLDHGGRPFTYPADTVGLALFGKTSAAYVYRGGRFVRVATSD